MRQNSDYTFEVDGVSEEEWSELLRRFDDTSIYQTWSYGKTSRGGKALSHVMLRDKGEVVAMAQVRIMKVPLIERGIAYVYYGPLWRLSNNEYDRCNLQKILGIMYSEYVVKRNLLLRIVPNIIENGSKKQLMPFLSAGFLKSYESEGARTLLVDLSPSLEEIRKRFRSNWRNHLKKAEKTGLKIIEGSSDELYQVFQKMYFEMLSRKRFTDTVDIDKFKVTQEKLPRSLKMNITICEYKGEPVSAAVTSAIGDTAEYILGATSEKGKRLKGSYLIQWRIIERLKTLNCRWYDLGGIDPESNPGVYHFKAGLGGDDVRYMGQFEACNSIASYHIVRSGDHMKRLAGIIR
jgi:lipid II:glycine glycyltransferase (peptidoglycan interpeptide bridge formation enzyme)